jgi:GWxTD domain-containing protein
MKRTSLWILAAVLAAAGACRLYNIERGLPPEDAEWLSRVRYLITPEERKVFLELPAADRSAAKEEFWARRDTDPETEENEFRTQYYDRMKTADDLFKGEGRPGWATDRGRIFILFGPPSERLTYPMEARGRCREVWYYGAFPVVFIDEHCSGSFVMTAVNLQHLQELNKAQDESRKTAAPAAREVFDFDVALLKAASTAETFEGRFAVDVPFENIWFDARGDRLVAAFDLRLELRDPQGRLLWETRQTFDLDLAEAELAEKRGRIYRMDVPFVLAGDRRPDPSRKVRLHIVLKTNAEGRELKKTIEFRLE